MNNLEWFSKSKVDTINMADDEDADAPPKETPAADELAADEPAADEPAAKGGAAAAPGAADGDGKTAGVSFFDPSTAPRPPQDPLNTEFLYYSAVLRILGPTLSHEKDRRVVIPWVRKLFRPEYHSSKLKEKRNRYLVYLSASLLLDEAIGIFSQIPPDGALPELDNIDPPPAVAAQWELDKTWQDTLSGLPTDFQMLECCAHTSADECKQDHHLDKILDQEFQLMLYIAKPYAYLIQNGNDRTRVAAWLQMLCSIHGKDCCSSMKAIRNDYMMALMGYLHDLRAVGPFLELPSWKTLPPLAEAAKAAAENQPITDPTGTEANEFLLHQPMPEDGAFCYIALTGELVTSNLIP